MLVLVIGYALLTGFQMFLQIPMDWRLAVSKFLLAIMAMAVIELLNRQPLAVRDVKAGHGQHGDAPGVGAHLLHRGQAGHGAHTGHSDGGGVAGKGQRIVINMTVF